MAGRASVAMACKYCTGDVIAQKAASFDAELDRRRAGYFFGFGAYYGIVNYNVFRFLAWSPWPVNPWAKAVASACFDGLVHVPISFYPQFYFVKEFVTSSEKRTPQEHFQVGLSKYRANWKEDVFASAAVFIPLGIANFRCARPCPRISNATGPVENIEGRSQMRPFLDRATDRPHPHGRSFVPLVWRTPFLSLVGVIFPIVLSTQRGATDEQ